MMAPLTRRSLIGGAAAAPVALAAKSVPGASIHSWEQALAAYRSARRWHELFLYEVLDPAVRHMRPAGEGLPAHIIALEDRADELGSARYDALRTLAAVPVDDLATLRIKFRLVYDEVLRFEDGDGYVHAILVDLERQLE